MPELNAFNNGIGIAYLHLLIKYFEFGLLKGPYLDGYRAKGRGKFRSAIDLCVNSRMVGLNLDLDQGTIGTVRPLKPKTGSGRRGSVSGYEAPDDDGQNVAGQGEQVHVESWLPRPVLSRTKPQALKRHALLALRGLWIIDFLLALERYVAADTLGNPFGRDDAMRTFTRLNVIKLLPGTPLEMPCPTFLTESVITLAVGTTIWQGLVGGYHLFAFFAILAGWEVESWEIDLMDSPWKCESLLDMWGRRWHQLFRVSPFHMAIALANDVASILAHCKLHSVPPWSSPGYNSHHRHGLHSLGGIPLVGRIINVARSRYRSLERVFHLIWRRLWIGSIVQATHWSQGTWLARKDMVHYILDDDC